MLEGGAAYYGYPIGILGLHSLYPKPLGHMRNAMTFAFPLLDTFVEGVSPLALARRPIPREAAERITQAALNLEAQHVRAIVGSCGYLLPLQEEISARLKVPFLSSSLLLLPFLQRLHGEKAVIGVLAASSSYYDDFDWASLGVHPAGIRVRGLAEDSLFWRMLRGNGAVPFDAAALRAEILEAAGALAPGCDALLLECTDICVFSHDIAAKTNAPVYDINAAISFLYTTACRHTPTLSA